MLKNSIKFLIILISEHKFVGGNMKITKFKKMSGNKYKVFLDNSDIIILNENVILDYNLLITKEINNDYCCYWLISSAIDREGYGLSRYDAVTAINGKNEYVFAYTHPDELGIRPGFYLNEANLIIKSGSGTEEDPYIVDGAGQNGVAVFSNGEELSMDQKPVEENERLLVPARAVFESLGAEVEWDEEKEVVTATDGETEIVMQIDNAVMEKSKKGEEEEISLEAAPRIIGERTMVPLRAVSEAFSAKVDYIEELNRVVIDKQPAPSPDPNWCPPWYKRMFGCSK